MQPGINSSSASSIFHAVFLEDYHFSPLTLLRFIKDKGADNSPISELPFFSCFDFSFFVMIFRLSGVNQHGTLTGFFVIWSSVWLCLLWAADFNLINFPHRLFAVLSVHQKWSFYFRASWASRWLIPPQERSSIFIITALWKAFS